MVLESHMFITKKHDGNLKARKVAGGNKQHGFIDKEDASSPTLATESVLLFGTIDAMEIQEVCVVDISNDFVQIHVDDKTDQTLVRIRGDLVSMLVKIASDVYSLYVDTEK